MSLRRAIQPDAWVNIAQEQAVSLRSLRLPPVVADPPWPLDVDRLARLTLRWPRATRPAYENTFLAPVRQALARLVRIEPVDIEQPVSSLVLTELVDGGDVHRAAFDTFDSSSFRDEELLRTCLIYFKFQHRREGYEFPQVVPGGHLTDKGTIYRYLPYLRALRDRQRFTADVFGRFGLRFNGALRRQALDRLSAQDRFRFRGGTDWTSRVTFLQDIARSRVCIELPGQADAFSLRLISGLAVGACLVGPRPTNVLPAPLLDGVHMAWTRDDLSDLVEVCERYVRDDAARERMVLESRRYFDRYLHADSLAAYYLHTCLSRLS